MNPKTSTAADATPAALGQLVPDLRALHSHVTHDVVLGQHVMPGPELYARAQAEGRPGELLTNQHPGFAPVIHPTLEARAEALVVAWLASLAA